MEATVNVVDGVVFPARPLPYSRFNLVRRLWTWLSVQPPRVLVYLALIILLTSIVSGGFHTQGVAQANSGAKPLAALDSPISEVDATATVYIAANVASELQLPVAEVITKQVNQIGDMVGSENGLPVASKTQSVNTPGATSRSLQTYTVKEGDLLAQIAKEFNISAQTIIWANGITSSADLIPNMELRIPPVDGVLHRVKEGDSLPGIAATYQANADTIVSFNDLELDGLEPGQLLIIPDGVPAAAQVLSDVSAPAAFNTAFLPAFNGNGYDYGYCTWHVANRRAQTGHPIPSNWGNAIEWRYNAAASGYTVGQSPQAGAVAWHRDIGGLGHVAFVEKITDKGIWLSDMNYPTWGQMTHRFVPASEFGNYYFIY